MARGKMSKKSVYRSGFEDGVASQLEANGIKYEYEKHKIAWVNPATNCIYTPDFYCKGVFYETKGIWELPDRKKMMHVIKQHPDKKFCMVFQQPNKPIRKGSKTTYAMWCDNNKIDHCTVDEMIERLTK